MTETMDTSWLDQAEAQVKDLFALDPHSFTAQAVAHEYKKTINKILDPLDPLSPFKVLPFFRGAILKFSEDTKVAGVFRNAYFEAIDLLPLGRQIEVLRNDAQESDKESLFGKAARTRLVDAQTTQNSWLRTRLYGFVPRMV